MIKEIDNSISLHREGVYDVCVIGFAGLALALLSSGFLKCDLWHKSLQMSSVVRNPNALALANEIMARGLFQMGLGVYSAIGSVAAGVRRLRM